MKQAFTMLIAMLSLLCTVWTSASAEDVGGIVSTADFTYKTFATASNRAVIEFDVTANTLSDGVIGLTASNITPKNYSDYAICFRIRQGGFFDANNGADFTQVSTVLYQVNQPYHVRIEADMIRQRYSAFVVIDGEPQPIAMDYAFRTAASNLAKITARGGGGVAAGLYHLDNITVTPREGEFDVLQLPNFFMNNMVLQRGEAHVIYGRSNAETVQVTLGDGNTQSSGSASTVDGQFTVKLDPLPASLDPYTLTVSAGDRTITIDSVYIGDVFFLAGQSNMAQTYTIQMREQLGDGVTAANVPVRVADERIKFVTLAQQSATAETFDVPFLNGAGWQSLTTATNSNLSYIGMFFAQDRLADEPNVPIGLIGTAWNGTRIDAWMRKSAENKTDNYTPEGGAIYNNHVAPFTKYPVSAILWYQGESDSKTPLVYEEAFQTLISDYRKQWGKADLPFLFVQLARYSKDDYQYQREAQCAALKLPNTGMAVILDADHGTVENIHPLGKELVAERLYRLAQKYVYGQDVVAQGPLYEGSVIDGSRILVSFRADTIGDGLCITNTYGASSSSLQEFQIAGRDGNFVAAQAVIEGSTVAVWSDSVAEPAYVRYAYARVPENPNLFNKNGLPASPFCTDARLLSTDSFFSRSCAVEDGAVQTADFVLVPIKDRINGVVGFTAKQNAITAWNSCGVTIRFQEDGHFGYIDGADFVTSPLTYSAGTRYRVKLLCDFTKNTYAAIVNGALLCENAAFRNTALPMKNMGRFLVRGGYEEAAGEFYLDEVPIIAECAELLLRVQDGDNEVVFAIKPQGTVRMAHYEGLEVTATHSTDADPGVKILKAPLGNNRLFLWDDNMAPRQGWQQLMPAALE